MAQPRRFEVKNDSSLNTKYSEFAPVFFKDGLVFTSNRERDIVNFEMSGWKNEPYFNIYFAQRSKEGDKTGFKTPVIFSPVTNSLFHDGFASFSGDQTELFFSRIALHATSGKVIEPCIYRSKSSEGKWGKPELMKLADDSVWVSHPSISADGKRLFFSSDMPGGFGGKDIYFSEKKGDHWGAPENAGPMVNTPFDEICPYIRRDNVLFFSSTGHLGFGGFDIFSCANSEGEWMKAENLGAPLNSSTDDFSIVFAEDNQSGFFASDRPGGKGGDDIYSFIQMSLVKMRGKVLLSRDLNQPARGMKLMLMSEDGQVIAVTTTDDAGFFQFEKLSPDKKYLVKMDEADPHFNPGKRYYLTNEQNKIIGVTVINERGEKFVFEKLVADLNTLKPMEEERTSLQIAGTLLVGENPSRPFAFKRLILSDENGNIIKVMITNGLGSFVFTELDLDRIYFLSADEKDAGLYAREKIRLTNSSKKEIAIMMTGTGGSFRFKLLKGEQQELAKMRVEDDQLKTDLKGRIYADSLIHPLLNMKMELINEQGQVQQTITSTGTGGFTFSTIPFNQSFLVHLDETEPALKNVKKILFTDEKGTIIKVIYLNRKHGFRFQILRGDFKNLMEVYVDDPWLKVLQFKGNGKSKGDSITIVESIYYNLNDYKVLPEARIILDKVVNIMKNNPDLGVEVDSHTDSRASDEYNLALSQKRAKEAVDYIVKNGISEKRIKGIGYGETRLINRCGNGVDCTEEEHAKNRRTEFIVRSSHHPLK
jgi:outer membrane protein OmpA-like peptidoglycan-associated protein